MPTNSSKTKTKAIAAIALAAALAGAAAPAVAGSPQPDILRSVTKPALGGVMQAIINMGQQRKRNLERSVWGTEEEMAEFNRGLISGCGSIAHTKAMATHDAKRLMLIATQDVDTFARIYGGIQKFIYTY